jgi:hypothetical protein
VRGPQVRSIQFGKARELDGAPLRTVANAYRLLAALVEAEVAPDVKTQGGPIRRTNKPSIDRSKHDRQHGVAFARGGADRMFKGQAAGPAKPGRHRRALTIGLEATIIGKLLFADQIVFAFATARSIRIRVRSSFSLHPAPGWGAPPSP